MHSLTNLLLLFFIYSFAGWVLETIFGTIRHKVFTNKGLVTGPFCVIYGIGAVVVSVTLNELTGFWLFVFAMTYATIIEWIAGHLIEKFFGERWWDYSKVKWNLDGYICLPASALWGALGSCTDSAGIIGIGHSGICHSIMGTKQTGSKLGKN